MSHPLSQRIDQLARRLSRQRWGAALGWVVAVALAVAGALMLADYAYRSHDTGLRWLAAAVFDAAIVYALYRLAGPLWRRPVTEQAVAQEVQQQFPKLGSRLASALEFLKQPTDDPQAGSQELRRAVVVDTASEVEQLPIETIVNPIPARRAIAAVLLAVAGLLVFGLSDPGGIKIAAGRLLAPWSDLEWPREHHLAVVDVKTRIARGGPFEATVVDLNGPLPDDLQVVYRSESKGNGRLDTQPLPIAGKEGVARRENVQQPFAFRIVGGDDDTMEWTEVQVVDPPTVGELAIEAHPPAYTRLPTENLGLDLRLLAGTQLALTAHSPQTLSSAVVEVTTGEEVYLVPAEIASTKEEGSRIHIPAERWIATALQDEVTNSRYCLRIEDAEGLIGRTESRRMVVEPDALPEVTWETPSSDTFVTAGAEVPISARVSDNLAVQWVELVAERSASEESSPPTERVRIHTGPATPPQPDASNETLTTQATWSLAPLELAEGDSLLLTVEAADYRPGVGRTAVSRRLTIISAAELEARIAEGATALARQLERALADQRSVRDVSRSIESDRRAGKPIDRAVSDRLTTLGYEQRQVAKALSDETQGAGEQAGQLLDEIKNNGLDRPELVEQLRQVEQEVARLSEGPLPDADRGLADARREAEREASDPQNKTNEGIGQSLAAADQEQTKVVESLEGLVDGLGQWTDRQRFVREAAELERGQRDLAAETRRAAAQAAAAPNDAATRATQQKIAEAQAELSRRFDRLQRGLREKIQQSQDDSATHPPNSTAPMEDALAETDERATGGKMADASRRLERGQMGRAAEQQSSAAEDLQRMLDTLRNQAPRDPKQLAEALREAAEELAELRQQAAEEASPADDKRQAEQQKQQREKLADQAERMGRKLERLSAEESGQSAGESGEQMSQAASQSQSSPQDASQSMEQADQKLADAQQQLQQRQQELENQITQTVLEKLASKIDGYIARQRSVLEGAVLAADAADEPRREATARLAGDERSLQQLIAAAAEELSSRAVFSMVLGSTSQDMQQTAERLEVADASRTTQRKARSALQRLQHIAQVLKPDPNLPPPDSEQQQPPPGGGQGDGKQPPPPPVDIAELKMLRLMQLDLNAQTRALEADTAESLLSQSESRATTARLAAEQDQLADLVRELAARDNAPTEQPPLETN